LSQEVRDVSVHFRRRRSPRPLRNLCELRGESFLRETATL